MWLDQGSSREIRRMPKRGGKVYAYPWTKVPNPFSVRFGRLNAAVDRKKQCCGAGVREGRVCAGQGTPATPLASSFEFRYMSDLKTGGQRRCDRS